MTGVLEGFGGTDGCDNCFELGILKLDDLVAAFADEVIVLRVAVVVFIVGSQADFQPAEHSGFHEFGQSAVDGRPADLQAPGFQVIDELLGIEMIVFFENKAHEIALLIGVALGLRPGGQELPKFLFGSLRNRDGGERHLRNPRTIIPASNSLANKKTAANRIGRLAAVLSFFNLIGFPGIPASDRTLALKSRDDRKSPWRFSPVPEAQDPGV